MGRSIQNLSEPRHPFELLTLRLADGEIVQPCQVPDSMAWIIAHGTWGPRVYPMASYHMGHAPPYVLSYSTLLIDLTEWLYRQHTHLPTPQNTPTPGATQ